MLQKKKQAANGTSFVRNFSSLRKGSITDQIIMITMSTNKNTKIIPNKWMSLITCKIKPEQGLFNKSSYVHYIDFLECKQEM